MSTSAVETAVPGGYRVDRVDLFSHPRPEVEAHDAERDATADRRVHRTTAGGSGADMSTTLDAAVESYLRAKSLSRGTLNEYHSTVRKWQQWGGGVSIEAIQRKDVR